METLELKYWAQIDSFMQERVDAAKRVGDSAIRKDWQDFNNTELVRRVRDDADDWWIAKTLWDIRMPDGSTRTVGPGEAVGLLEGFMKDYEKSVNNAWDQIQGCWDDNYKLHLQEPKKLWDAAENWKKVSDEVYNLAPQVQNMQMAQHWQGDGANAYRKVVPAQAEATAEQGKLVGLAGNVLYNGAAGLQVFLMTFAVNLVQLRLDIEQVQVTDPNAMGWRMQAAAAYYASYNDFFRNKLEKKKTDWYHAVIDAQKLITDHKTLPEVFADSKWPESVAHGDVSQVKPGAGMPGLPGTGMPDPTTNQDAMDPRYRPTERVSADQPDQNMNKPEETNDGRMTSDSDNNDPMSWLVGDDGLF